DDEELLRTHATQTRHRGNHVRDTGQPLGKEKSPARALFKEHLRLAHAGVGLEGDAAEQAEHTVSLSASQLVPNRITDNAGHQGYPETQVETHLPGAGQRARANQYRRKE